MRSVSFLFYVLIRVQHTGLGEGDSSSSNMSILGEHPTHTHTHTHTQTRDVCHMLFLYKNNETPESEGVSVDTRLIHDGVCVTYT